VGRFRRSKTPVMLPRVAVLLATKRAQADPSVQPIMNHTQVLVLGFLLLAWVSLLTILAVAPDVYDQALQLSPLRQQDGPVRPSHRRVCAHRCPRRWGTSPLALDILAGAHRFSFRGVARASLHSRARRLPAFGWSDLIRGFASSHRTGAVRDRARDAGWLSTLGRLRRTVRALRRRASSATDARYANGSATPSVSA